VFFEGGHFGAVGCVFVSEVECSLEERLVDFVEVIHGVTQEGFFFEESFFVCGLVTTLQADFAFFDERGGVLRHSFARGDGRRGLRRRQ